MKKKIINASTEKTQKYLEDFNNEYMKLREKEGFSGIGYQMSLIDENMKRNFERTSSIKHRGDKGSARENLLRDFLRESGYIPDKFGISEGSSHVISTTGHISNQVDLLIFDKLNSPKLMSIDDIQYFPIESVYGIIEVKSNIDSKDTLFDALKKIKSFKSLKKSISTSKNFGGMTLQFPASMGFGILFAYEATLAWKTIFDYIKEFQNENLNTFWPNLIVILNQGFIYQFKETINSNVGVFSTEEINKLSCVKLAGYPSKNNNLLDFYLILMDLLTNMNLPAPPLRYYTTLRIANNKYSYNFSYGQITEVGQCDKHGKFLRRITDENIEKILKYCSAIAYSNLLEAIDEAMQNGGLAKDNYERQKRLVKIYNPENIPLSDILVFQNGGLAFDDITIEDEYYLIPYYYSHKEKLITECPECSKNTV
jgi:hypothetical protein